MPANYYTITQPVVWEIEIKKSRFITYLFPIKDEQEAQEKLQQIKKEHYKAAHHCSAFILNEQSSIQRMSDDGEPQGTAGVPMLEVLKKNELTYILAIVVRYFGGVKLGAGGLIRAYSSAVSEALQEALIMQNINQAIIHVTIQYHQVDSLQHYIEHATLPITVLNTHYLEKVTYELAVNVEDEANIEKDLIAQFNGQVKWEKIDEQTINIPISKD